MGVGWQFLVKAVLAVLVQGFREQQGYLAVSLLCSCLMDLLTPPEVLRHVSSHKRPPLFVAVISHFADRSDLTLKAPNEYSPGPVLMNKWGTIDIKEEQIRICAKSTCSYKITSPFLKPCKLCLANFHLLRMLDFTKKVKCWKPLWICSLSRNFTEITLLLLSVLWLIFKWSLRLLFWM